MQSDGRVEPDAGGAGAGAAGDAAPPAEGAGSPDGADSPDGTGTPGDAPARLARFIAWPQAPLLLLGALVLLSVGLRSWTLMAPVKTSASTFCAHDPEQLYGLIFDERYYVDAARLIAGRADCAGDAYYGQPAGLDPNREHPPLGKLIMVAGIDIFGDTPLGWRTPSIIAGTLEILLLYWLVRCAGGSSWLALGAAALGTLDNLTMVHGRIGTLDVFVVVFMLAGIAVYLRERPRWLWPALAGALLGLACCVKLYAIWAVVVLAVFEVIRISLRQLPEPEPAGPDEPRAPPRRPLRLRIGRPRRPHPLLRFAMRRLLAVAAVSLALAVTYYVALTVMDQHVTTFGGPLAALHHTQSMLDYGKNLRQPNGPVGIASYPWWWWGNAVNENYYTLMVEGQTKIFFQGALNWAILVLALPALAVNAYLAVRDRDRPATLSVAWVVGTWVPFEVLSLDYQRIEYLYYMVVIVPGIYIGLPRLFSLRVWRRPTLRRLAVATFVVALLFCVGLEYPLRTWPWE